jgi:hypothetical protein
MFNYFYLYSYLSKLFTNVFNHSLFEFINILRLNSEVNNNLVVIKAELPLEIVPQIFDGLSIITAKLPVVSECINTVTNMGPLLENINYISTKVLPAANVSLNSIDNNHMLQ